MNLAEIRQRGCWAWLRWILTVSLVSMGIAGNAAAVQDDDAMELTQMVDENQLLHPTYRAEAAYALAGIDARNPKWLAYLKRMRGRKDDYSFAAARLAQLERETAEAPQQ